MTKKDALVKNTDDAKQVKNASVVQELKEDEEDNDVRFVLNDARGRRFLWRVLSHTGMFMQAHVPGDPCSTAFNDGRSCEGRWLYSLLEETSVDAVNQMRKEAQEKRNMK